ncbi:MAG: potassium channel family protein [Gammaproteobacteria bacterium]|nr:potassium channel family protein [Gammaproteobacteria bacterium]
MIGLADRLGPAHPFSRLVGIADARRCTLLLACLVLLLVLYPYLDGEGVAPGLLLETITSAVLLAGLYAISRRSWELFAGLMLIVPALFGNWSDAHATASLPELVMVASETVFFAFMTVMILRYVVSDRLLVGDRLQGALSAYLLLGLLFSTVFELLEMLAPGSLHFPNGPPTWSDYLYFSFVTLTTLGYGDIAPVTPEAQSLAILQSTTGVLYVAVLVAWLVSALREPAGQVAASSQLAIEEPTKEECRTATRKTRDG